MSGGHCPKCWSGVPLDAVGLCRACYSWYQDWLYRRLPEQKASRREWEVERRRWSRWADVLAADDPAVPRRQPDEWRVRWPAPPATPQQPLEWIPRPTWGVPDPCYFTDPGPGWDNAVRAYEDVTGEDMT